MEIKLSDHFNYKRILKFTYPIVIMMIFKSIYGVVDGFFISNFVGKTPFAAETMAVVITVIFLFAKRKKYGY